MLSLVGCRSTSGAAPILATTKPVYDFTVALCEGTDLSVGLLINDSVSCLHDYSLSTSQMRSVEDASLILMSGAGLEEFAEKMLDKHPNKVDCSKGVALLECHEEHDHHHDHEEEADGHIWLSPANAKIMAANICKGLTKEYPSKAAQFEANLAKLNAKLDALQAYGEERLGSLRQKDLITFHDGFGYFADCFGLTILEAVEEEDGSMISPAKRIELTALIRENCLPAIFTEINGIAASANAIAKDVGIPVFVLDMCMSSDYFTGMYHNIDTIKEALG